MDQRALKKQLDTLSPACRVAFAARAAMRVLPALMLPRKGLLGETVTEPAFWSWNCEQQQQHISSVLHANICAACIGAGGKVPISILQAIRRSANIHADAAGSVAAFAAAFAASAAVHASQSSNPDAQACTTDAADAAASAEAAARRFHDRHTLLCLDKQLSADLLILQTRSGADLLALPLWPQDPPIEWTQHWQTLQTRILQLDPGFSIWLTCYQERLEGHPLNLPLLEKWLHLPPEIADLPLPPINAYLANLANGSACNPQKRVRTIFIGFVDAGKTSLIRALHGEPVIAGEEAMTSGIDIREWPGAGNGITTHFWDFGGKLMAHSTHPFFLRSSCLYVLVLSTRNEMSATEQAEYWLQHINVYGGDSPIIIALNKSDRHPLHLDLASLKQKYPNIVADFSLACTQAQSGPLQAQFVAFENALREQINQLSQHQTLFTDAQFAVLQGLRTATTQQALLEHNEFQRLCDQHGIPFDGVQNRDWLLKLFDKLGVLIHFPQMDQLQEQIINPRWLTYGVYQIMLAGRARLRPTDFIDILHSAKLNDEHQQNLNYPPHKCKLIALAMTTFKLCYRLPGDEDQLIIPGLLDPDLPANIGAAGFNQAQALLYKVSFNGFVPRHVMPELIVLHNTEIIHDLVWQNGAVLQCANLQAKAWLQVDYQSRELCIWLQDRDAKSYFATLRQALLKILARLTLNLRESIRLPKSALSPTQAGFDMNEDWAVYQQIEAYIKRGDRTFVSETGHEYDLAKIAKFYLTPTHPAQGSLHEIGKHPEHHPIDTPKNRTGVITAEHIQNTIKHASTAALPATTRPPDKK